MAYRDDAGDALEAETSSGTLRARFAPRELELACPGRTLLISGRFATVITHGRSPARGPRDDRPQDRRKDRRTSYELAGRLVVARGVPREDLGIWIDVAPGTPRAGMRRIFGVEPVSLLEPGGLAALAALDRLSQRLRHGLAELAGDVRRAFEIGSPASGGLDKVLLADRGDRFEVHARRLFRDRARFVAAIHDDGRIVLPGPKPQQFVVRSRFGVTVRGDDLRFADPTGTDLGHVSIPWIAPEDRHELARRIAQLVDHDQPDEIVWPPKLDAAAEPR